MTTLDDRHAPSPSRDDPGSARLRVVLLLDVLDGRQQRFLEAYEAIRHQVAAVPGHVSDQLCQSLGNSSQWLITSEWEGSEPFLEWVESAEHRRMVEPLHGCVRDTTSLRFVIERETPEREDDERPAKSARSARSAKTAKTATTAGSGKTAKATRTAGAAKTAKTARSAKTAPGAARAKARPAPAAGLDPLPTPPLCSGGVVRHAITFTVKPGSEESVAKLLSDYRSPRARVDGTTRLLRTSLFMHENRVVRAVEVAGDLGNALRHVAAQPEVRSVEEAINPYLEQDRDLTDSSSARAFFARAALPAADHVGGQDTDGPLTRYAFIYPVRAGHAADAARLLTALDTAAVSDPAHPLVAATVFHRDDNLVRVVDLLDGPVYQGEPSADVRQLLIPGGPEDPDDPTGLAHGGHPMRLLTDRMAPPSR